MIRALQYYRSIPRYALQKVLGMRSARWASRWAPLRLTTVEAPKLPGADWVRIRPMRCGVCGSDVATVTAKNSPYLAPVTSLPFVPGHELVGRVAEVGDAVDDLPAGARVVVQPALGCAVRGIEPACAACARGEIALCHHVTRGNLAAGIQTGYCRDTGGGWSESLVAHRSQVWVVPDALPDDVAVLVEPFACALHGVLRAEMQPGDTAFVVGCGCIGLLTIAALRATGFAGRIVAVAKHEHQRMHALRLGADEVLQAGGSVNDRYARWAAALKAEVLAPELGKPTVLGGATRTFDCVASSTTLDDCIRFTAAGGTLMLIGMPAVPKQVDWTPLWFKELNVRASYAYGRERWRGEDRWTFELALEWLPDWAERLRPLLSAPFALEDYRAALDTALGCSREPAVKTVFRIDE
jgi:threonine dehydrogenase-like Zn-dependent dehydrogenase